MCSVEEIHSLQLDQRPSVLKSFGGRDGCSKICVGTYQLVSADEGTDHASSSRAGSLVLLCPLDHISVKWRLSLPAGVFRFGFDGQNSLYMALSNGYLAKVDENELDNMGADFHVKTIEIDNRAMILDLSFADEDNFTGGVLCSDNFGKLHIVNSNGQVGHSWIAHRSAHSMFGQQCECEVWCCEYLDSGGQICVSGAEDGLLKVWDLRCHPQKRPQMENSSHAAGIISLRKIHFQSYTNGLLLTGCYDDHVRLFDVRNVEKPINSLKLNGGVWDIQRITDGADGRFIAACMYGGWSIFRYIDGSLVQEYCHSLNGPNLIYGACAVPITGTDHDMFGKDAEEKAVSICSCAFNSRTLYLEKIVFDGH